MDEYMPQEPFEDDIAKEFTDYHWHRNHSLGVVCLMLVTMVLEIQKIFENLRAIYMND